MKKSSSLAKKNKNDFCSNNISVCVFGIVGSLLGAIVGAIAGGYVTYKFNLYQEENTNRNEFIVNFPDNMEKIRRCKTNLHEGISKVSNSLFIQDFDNPKNTIQREYNSVYYPCIWVVSKLEKQANYLNLAPEPIDLSCISKILRNTHKEFLSITKNISENSNEITFKKLKELDNYEKSVEWNTCINTLSDNYQNIDITKINK